MPVELVVKAGRPWRVALDRKIRLRRVGQPVTAALVEDVYARDRLVLPAGTKVAGHVERLDKASKRKRVRAIMSGDLTPLRGPVVKFDKPPCPRLSCPRPLIHPCGLYSR